MDDGGTTGEGGRWLSYAELAELRGITRKAAARLTLRHGWRRQPGNDGATRVLVPPDIERRQTPRDDGPLTLPSDGAATVAVWRERAEGAERRADAADADRRAAIALTEQTVALLTDTAARAEVAERRADQAEAGREAERTRADALRDRIEATEAQLAAAEQAAEQAQRQAQAAQDNAEILREADAARKGRGRLARLRAAWRGE